LPQKFQIYLIAFSNRILNLSLNNLNLFQDFMCGKEQQLKKAKQKWAAPVFVGKVH
jgi:hypothetical protein